MNLLLAKKRVREYQHYINLTESYEVKDFRTLCIKHYAITGNLTKCLEVINELDYRVDGRIAEKQDIVKVINSNPSRSDDELHRIVRKHYRSKIRQ